MFLITAVEACCKITKLLPRGRQPHSNRGTSFSRSSPLLEPVHKESGSCETREMWRGEAEVGITLFQTIGHSGYNAGHDVRILAGSRESP